MFPGDHPDSQAAENALMTPDTVLVTGPMGSGTRLLAEVVAASGVPTLHDPWHATIPRPANRVLVSIRERESTRRSRDSMFEEVDRIPRETSLAGCLTFYPDALWVTYEQLCHAPEATIEVIAAWLGVAPWSMPVAIVHSPRSFYTEVCR